MFTSVKDRSVIVTGASKGIGKGIAEVFARAGAKVLVVARNGDAAEEVARGISDKGGLASATSADVTSEEEMAQMASIAIDRHGGLDILCANAGIYPQTKLEEMTCLLYTSPSPRDKRQSRMPSSA